MAVNDDILAAEAAVRDIIVLVLNRKSQDWWNDPSIMPTSIARICDSRAAAAEGQRGVLSDRNKLEYAQLSQLKTVLEHNWGNELADCFGDEGKFIALFETLIEIRNNTLHGRPLIPFQESLAIGISGFIRNASTIYRSKSDVTSYAIIDVVRDSFGNELPTISDDYSAGPVRDLNPGLTLSIGHTLTFECSGTHPAGRELKWVLYYSRYRLLATTAFELSDQLDTPPADRVIDSATGDSVTLKWTVGPDDVGEHCGIEIALIGDGDYHRLKSVDDLVGFTHRVAPPADLLRPRTDNAT